MPSSTMAIKGRDAAPAPLFLKTKFCKFYQTGRCKRGQDCKYAHDEAEMRPLPDFSRTRLCPFVRDHGYCPKGPSCSFAHAPEELRVRTPDHSRFLEDYKALLGAPAGPVLLQPAPFSPPPPPAFPPTFPACGKKCCSVDDEDDDFDLPASSWSRQSTQEPADEAADFAAEFSSEEEWEELEGSDVAADASDVKVEKVADELNEGLLAFASTLGLALSVKNSFLDVDDGEVVGHLRRAKSMGDLLAAC